MAIKGILFDKDGTLLDFMSTWMPAIRVAALAAARGDQALALRLMRAGGYDPDRERIAANALLAAGNAREIAAAWMAMSPGWRLDDLAAQLDEIFEAEAAAVAVTDLEALFARLKKRGLSLGVASSDSARGIEVTLAPFGVMPQLDFVAGYDSGHGFKPEPGMVLGFCARTGIAAAEVVVVGDNPHDMEMGRRAGAALVVGVLTGNTERAELARLADYVLANIDALEALLDDL